jgi:hypothetical protein
MATAGKDVLRDFGNLDDMVAKSREKLYGSGRSPDWVITRPWLTVSKWNSQLKIEA